MDSAAEFYTLHVSSTFSGDAGDVLSVHNGMKFSANIPVSTDDDDDDVLRQRTDCKHTRNVFLYIFVNE